MTQGLPEHPPEEWLEDYQGGRASPLGRALRSTFDADNHHTLGNDVTGLMIDLSKVPYGDEPGAPPPPVVPPAPRAAVPPPPRFAPLAWLGELFGRRTA